MNNVNFMLYLNLFDEFRLFEYCSTIYNMLSKVDSLINK